VPGTLFLALFLLQQSNNFCCLFRLRHTESKKMQISMETEAPCTKPKCGLKETKNKESFPTNAGILL